MITIFNQRLQFVLPKYNHHWFLFLGILMVYAVLIVPTLSRMGIGWDEEIDLRIAQAYLTPRGFFFGIPLDLSQTRLPMFIVALVYRLFGVSDLLLARLTSVVVGGLTLLGIYVYGKDHFNYKVGLLAAGLLAVNPFFLSFARLAFTESDVYLACTLTWLLVALARLQERRTIGRAAMAGLVLGLSISAKATVLAVLPAVWAALYSVRFYTLNTRQNEVNISGTTLIPARAGWFWAGWAVLVLLVGVYIAMFLDIGAYSGIFRTLNYGLVGLGWLLPLGWAYRHRNQYADSIPLAAFVTGFGLLTFVIFPPDHLTNSGILRSLFLRAENEMSFSAAFVGEVTALHLLTLFIKSTPMLGLALLAGTVTSLAEWRQRELTLPLFVAISYFAGLMLLPLAQTFYTIPILPVLSLLVADQFLRLWSFRRKIALMAAVFTMGWWGVEMVQCYPDYHLNGYQWLGARPLFGRSSIGYRSVVYTPSDGVQQAVEWLNTNAEPGQTALLYVEPWHIVRYIAPDPGYTLTNGFDETLHSKPDFVVVHIGAILWQGEGNDTPIGDVIRYPFNFEVLTREYEQVFVVQRAFNLEMASVWQRK
jgi:4-amino-4-deoxy-L-arabinose transferase-like glycosyltransferase